MDMLVGLIAKTKLITQWRTTCDVDLTASASFLVWCKLKKNYASKTPCLLFIPVRNLHL